MKSTHKPRKTITYCSRGHEHTDQAFADLCDGMHDRSAAIEEQRKQEQLNTSLPFQPPPSSK